MLFVAVPRYGRHTLLHNLTLCSLQILPQGFVSMFLADPITIDLTSHVASLAALLPIG